MSTPLHVLIVEDSADDTKLMTRELRRYGFEPHAERVETERAMQAALDRDTWDLVLADYRLPSFSGPQALRTVQERGLDVPFILVSGVVGEEKAIAAMKAGAHDFVLKSSLARLGAAVTRELREAEVRRGRRKAEAALKLLADTSKLVAEARDHRAVLQGVVQLAVPALADWSIIYASSGQTLVESVHVARVEAVDERRLGLLADRYPPLLPWDPKREDALSRALRTLRPVLVSTVEDEFIARAARDDVQVSLLRELRLQSTMVVPLLARGQYLGLWIFAATTPGRFTDADLRLADDMAGRVALVAENARLSRAREDFISTAIHEIKTPVAVMKMVVQRMQELPPEHLQAKLPALLVRLDRQCSRLTRLVTAVVDVSRIELHGMALTRRRVSLAELVEQVVSKARSLAHTHRIIITHNEPVTVEIDTERVGQVLSHLLDNAIKYSPAGSTIEVASWREGAEVIVSVRDHGIGIPADRQDRIFDRFYRAHAGTAYDHAASLGVGLYVSREIIAHHQGRMWFESQEGMGSTFYFSLALPLEASKTVLPTQQVSPGGA